MFVMSNESNVGLVVSVEFDTCRKWLETWRAGSLQGEILSRHIWDRAIATACTNFVLPCMPMFAILLQYISLQSTIWRCFNYHFDWCLDDAKFWLSPLELDVSRLFQGNMQCPARLTAWFQVVLLDLYELWRLRVEYMPQLQMYEELHKFNESLFGWTVKKQFKIEKKWTIEIVTKHQWLLR